MSNTTKVEIDGVDIRFRKIDGEDWISMTDVAKKRSPRPGQVIGNWMRQKDTVEFLGVWEQLNNPGFKVLEFEEFKNAAGSNVFTLSPKEWAEKTGAIGIQSKSGRYGGTWGHIDIALDFCGWVNSAFRLWVVREFRRLKEEEVGQLDWELKRQLTKVNYHLQTDAVRKHLVPGNQRGKRGEGIFQASEADTLNLALWDMTAKEWRIANPKKKGNIRDHATKNELLVLNNMQAVNTELISQGLAQDERYLRLARMASYQLQLLRTKKLSI